jgi:hypothetical protein
MSFGDFEYNRAACSVAGRPLRRAYGSSTAALAPPTQQLQRQQNSKHVLISLRRERFGAVELRAVAVFARLLQSDDENHNADTFNHS